MQTLQSEYRMNRTRHSVSKAGFATVWLIALTGCTTYVQETPTRTVYAAPPPLAPPPTPEPAPPATVTAEVAIQTENDFVEPLNPYGEWVVVGSYGRCWRPLRVEAGWRPYCNGYWQRTDAGWFWASTEPWGWATYHYGRWDWTVNFGWVWMPQTQWAPSWVAWREGAGYVGWAPLPPTATIAVSGGVVFRDAAFAPRAFVFVEERRLLEPVRPRTVIVNNTTVINKTVNITKIQVVNKTVINEGPRPDVIERVSGRKVQAVAVRDLRHKEEVEVMNRHPALRREIRSTAAPDGTVRTPVRRESEPAINKAVEKAKEPQPPVTGTKPHEGINDRNGAVKSPRKASERPLRQEQAKPETTPAATRSAVKPEPKSLDLPREPRGVEKPAETVKEPQNASSRNRVRETEAQKPAVTAAPHEIDKPAPTEKARGARPETERPAAIGKPARPAVGKPGENQLKPSRGKSRQGGEPDLKEKDQKEKKVKTPEEPR